MSTQVTNDQIVSLAWTKLTGTPTTLAGYGIADAVSSAALIALISSANSPNTIVARDGSGNFAAGTITAALVGNASTATLAAAATVLATARAINGVNFDGSAAITIAAAAGTLTGTTLASGVLTSSLTTVGALNAGSITSGFGAINIGADAFTGGAINGSGLLSITGLGTHAFAASGSNAINTVNVGQSTAGTAAGARYTLNTDEGIAGILIAHSSTWTTVGFSIASSTAFEAVRAGGLSLAATNVAATATVRIYAGSNTNLIATFAAAAITMAYPVRLKGYTVATLPAGTVGYTAYATDLLAPTFLAAAVGGGAVTGPCFYNGAAWVTM